MGVHLVGEIIGVGQPRGMVFKGRLPINRCYWDCDSEMNLQNLITSRILRLVGLEAGLNQGPVWIRTKGIFTFMEPIRRTSWVHLLARVAFRFRIWMQLPWLQKFLKEAMFLYR